MITTVKEANMSIAEAAAECGVSEAAVRSWATRGVTPRGADKPIIMKTYRAGRLIRINRDDLERFLSELNNP